MEALFSPHMHRFLVFFREYEDGLRTDLASGLARFNICPAGLPSIGISA